MNEGKQRKQKQPSRRLKTSDVLEFLMSDVSHIANTLDRILEAVSGRQIGERGNKAGERQTKNQSNLLP